VTSTAATPTNAAPSDASDALIDVARSAQVVGGLLPLLRELERSADAAAAPEHNVRILNGPLQTSTQDANNEQRTETPPEAGQRPRSVVPFALEKLTRRSIVTDAVPAERLMINAPAKTRAPRD
jgi:hypothetical protein